MFRKNSLFLVVVLLISCKSSEEFTGYSYDPPGVTDTAGKTTTPQKRRVIGAGTPKVWISNEFEGARASDFYQINANTYEVLIEPENAPINNSTWFGFTIWSDSVQTINLRLRYKNGRHRYLPKVFIQKSFTANYSHTIQNARYDSTDGTAIFGIFVEPTPTRVTAQLLEGTRYSDLENKLQHISSESVSVRTAGQTHQGRNIYQVTVDETAPDIEKGVLILLSRQHPPEISGYRTFWSFLETMLGDSELAREFRQYFVIEAFPMINPDGVVNGHWRHNMQGIDLNRDWEFFNQPETRAVRDALLPIKNMTDRRVYYGIDFHSTNENIFYPILEPISTTPDNLTQRWAPIVTEHFPALNFSSEEFDTNSPISKNWIFDTFGSDALTFEVDDELSPNQMNDLGTFSAESLMKLLLEEWRTTNSN